MTASAWTIRDASSRQDWDAASGVLISVYVGEGFTAPEEASEFFSKNSLECHGDLLVAEKQGEGIVGAVLLLNERSQLCQVAVGEEAEFRLLAVSPRVRGEGIGSDLVRECISRSKSRGAGRMILSTQPSQHAAHRVYEALGFVRCKERDWRTARGSKRWVYALELA